MQRGKDLVNKIPFVVGFSYALAIMICVYYFNPTNLTTLITLSYLSFLLLVIIYRLLSNFAEAVIPPTAGPTEWTIC